MMTDTTEVTKQYDAAKLVNAYINMRDKKAEITKKIGRAHV